MKCEKCGIEYEGNACQNCAPAGAPPAGTPSPGPTMMFCSKCGKQILASAVVCPHCGSPTENFQKSSAAQAAPAINIVNTNTAAATATATAAATAPGAVYKPRSKVTALLLCIFLGFWGVHRFYVGKIGTGLIWFFTGGFFLIGWLIDLIMIITGGFRDKNGYQLA